MYVSTGSDLVLVDVETSAFTDLQIPHVKDVHWISVIRNMLWMANTIYDEAVGVDLAHRPARRIDLSTSRTHDAPSPDTHTGDVFFQCNQIFESHDGALWALVHHVDGKQRVLTMVANALKQQGNGGISNLDTGEKSCWTRSPEASNCNTSSK